MSKFHTIVMNPYRKPYGDGIGTNEFDLCLCGHKKINHGGLYRIINKDGMEINVQYGCIECEYEIYDIKYKGIPNRTFKKTLPCMTFRPLLPKIYESNKG